MAADSMESNFVSMKPAVEFVDILDQYSYNEDLECSFKFNDYTPQEGDRVAIFKLGWSFVKDYIVFEWAPVGSRQKLHSVIFNKHILPKNNTEIYQFCYISGENVLHGASSPIQFSAHLSPITTQNTPTPYTEVSCDTLQFSEKDELLKLKEENAMLRESLKAVIAQKAGTNSKNYDGDIKELKTITESLQSSLKIQQREINLLKTKIIESGEEYKKLYIEKSKIEKKFERLKNKIGDDVKLDNLPTTNMVNFDIGDLKSIPPFPFAK
ncbi:hypothetical protein NQ318_016984 [Aromia moschata]|uniref:SKICH domain-containing protein n=1 Tax=Aromia moschata TaxID=1265417 RepID=A0AAV8YD22_9CUCU|nr:hypothetical protein NQ318_016984 [Aromia moschata]